MSVIELRQRPAKVLLVDDHAVVRAGLRLLMESVLGLEVIEAESAPLAVEVVERTAVDLVLLDARMPGHDGLWALRQIRDRRPELPVLVLSTFDTQEYVQGALDNGAAGYLLKEASTEQLAEAIDTALTGRGIYLHPVVAQRMLLRSRYAGRGEEALSDRELEVLRLLTRGATNEEIADALYVAEKTVKSHLSSIFRKLGVSNRTQAATKALIDRLVT